LKAAGHQRFVDAGYSFLAPIEARSSGRLRAVPTS
jgi:hypothetical protein